MDLVGVSPDGGVLALRWRLFGIGGFWKRKPVSVAGTGGGMLASFAPLIALAIGGFEKLAALPR